MNLATPIAKTKGKPRGKPFQHGHKLSPGNPHGEAVANFHAQIVAHANTGENFSALVKTLYDKAKAGDVACIREYMDRCMGKAASAPEDRIAVAPETMMDDVRYVAILLRHQVPPDRWLPGIRERYQQGLIKVESVEVKELPKE